MSQNQRRAFVKTLKAAKKLIENPDNWCKGNFKFHNMYCSLGAVNQIDVMCDSGKDALDYSAKRLGFKSAVELNDHYRTTHKDVMRMFNLAIYRK